MIGILIFVVFAFLFSILLVFTNDYSNRKSKKQKKILTLLPGYNCGNCGFGSCEGMSEAMMNDLDAYQKCKPLRGEALERMQEYVRSHQK
jgi:electron transport complex protein RnfB